MTAVTIHRVETAAGRGPYSGRAVDDRLFDMDEDHSDERTHPSPYRDPGLPWRRFGSEHYCGFASEERLRSWFGDWVGLLDEIGFQHSIYEVDDAHVLAGEFQVVFRLAEARLISREPLLVSS